MATITIPETLTGQAGLNRWDSPWLNPKFMSGLVMVPAVLLLGLVGGRFWNEQLALVASSPVRGVDISSVALILALFSWAGPTRLIRAQVLWMRERGYVRMARLSGVPTFDIMFREMLPNMLPYLASSLAGNVAA